MKLFPALSLVLFACETFALPSPGTGSSNEPSKTRPFVLPPITPRQTTQAPIAQDASNAPRPFGLALLSQASATKTPPIAQRPKSLNNVKLNSQQPPVIAPKPTEKQEKIAQDALIRPPSLPRLNQAPIANLAPSSSKTETLPATPRPKSQKLNAMFGGQQPPIILPKPTDASKFEDIPLTVIGGSGGNGDVNKKSNKAKSNGNGDEDNESDDEEDEPTILPEESTTVIQTVAQSFWQMTAVVLLRKNVWLLINAYVLFQHIFNSLSAILAGSGTTFETAADHGDAFIEEVFSAINQYLQTLPQKLADFANDAILVTIKTALWALVSDYKLIFNFSKGILLCAASYSIDYVNTAISTTMDTTKNVVDESNGFITNFNNYFGKQVIPTFDYLAPVPPVFTLAELDNYISLKWIDEILNTYGDEYLKNLVNVEANNSIPPIEFPLRLRTFVEQNFPQDAITGKTEKVLYQVSTCFQTALLLLIIWTILSAGLRPWLTRPGMPTSLRKVPISVLPEIRVLAKNVPKEEAFRSVKDNLKQAKENLIDLFKRNVAVRGIFVAMVLAALMQILLLIVNTGSGPLLQKAKEWDAQIDTVIHSFTGPVSNTVDTVIQNIESFMNVDPLAEFIQQEAVTNPNVSEAFNYLRNFPATKECNPLEILVNATSFLFVLSFTSVLQEPLNLTQEILSNIQNNIQQRNTAVVQDALSSSVSDLKKILSSSLPWNTVLGTGGVYIFSKIIYSVAIAFVPFAYLKYLNIHPLPDLNKIANAPSSA